MAATVVSSLVEKLQLLINEEVKLIAGAVKEEFQRLLEQVERLQESLGGIISKKEGESKRLKNLEKVIRSIVYEIEDEIDEFLLQAKLQQEKNLFGIKCLDFDRGDRVQDLSSKIDSILDRINRFIHGKNHPDAKRVLIEDMRREARDVLPRKDGASVEPQVIQAYFMTFYFINHIPTFNKDKKIELTSTPFSILYCFKGILVILTKNNLTILFLSNILNVC